MMRREADSAPRPDAQQDSTDNASSDTGRDLLTTMIQSLLAQADTPPREVEGVNEEFCDSKMSTFLACLLRLCAPQRGLCFLIYCTNHTIIRSA